MAFTSTGSGSSPNTSKGDLHGHDGTSDVRVPVGSDGQILTADSTVSTGVAWGAPTTDSEEMGKNATQSIASGTITLVTWQTVTGTPFPGGGTAFTADTANNRWTIQETGIYDLYGYFFYTSNVTDGGIFLYVNGSFNRALVGGVQRDHITGSARLPLTASDNVELRAVHFSGASRTISDSFTATVLTKVT